MGLGTIGIIGTLALGILTAPLTARAQLPAKGPRIGWLALSSFSDSLPYLDAFQQGLRERGWVEGQNIVLEWRSAERQPDRLPDLAAELVQLPVDVIVVGNPLTAWAAKQATTVVPIVIVGVGDAVAAGLVASLARPGGNITGLSEQYLVLQRGFIPVG